MIKINIIKQLFKQIISFILPFTVLVLVPLCIEKDLSIKNIWTFSIGLIIMLMGLVVLIITIWTMIRNGDGTLAPWIPTNKLVITGIYGYLRNPMIISVLIILIGESISIISLNIIIWAFIFFIINNIFFFFYEEPNLEKKFGNDYRIYKKNVSRWMPRFNLFSEDFKGNKKDQ